MTNGGTDADLLELENFAKGARNRSGAVQDVVDDTTAVHLGQNVMGVVGACFVDDAGASLAKIVENLRNSVTALASDAAAAESVTGNFASNEQHQTDTFNRMDTQ